MIIMTQVYNPLTIEMLLNIEMDAKTQCLSDFFRLLKDNNAYDSYLHLMLEQKYMNGKTRCHSLADMKHKLLYNNDPSSWLGAFFLWGCTNEGVQFWGELSNKWNIISSKYYFPFD